ncbi:metal ABC transporter ATP-binding protein [Velocimicrobium porci]|nr:metal ABC transporter ATP-binding protein [Velocimicrobium porci]
MNKLSKTVGKKNIVNATMKKSKNNCGFHCIRIKDFGVKIGDTNILDHINVHIHCGELTSIIGKNGAGKSTLIRAILNEIKHEGTIEFKDIKNNEYKDLRIGYVPQHLNIAKNTPTSVYDLLASYVTRTPVFFKKNKKAYQMIKKQLAQFEAEELIDKTVCDLSGGQLQRVLLSLAMMPMPNLLILDEPVSGIDHNGMELFFEKIDYLKKNCDLAVILVSHDLEYVAKYSDHVILLDHTIQKEGTAEEVFSSTAFKETFGEKIVR